MPIEWTRCDANEFIRGIEHTLIVRDDDFEILKSLRQAGTNRLFQKIRAIVSRRANGDQRRVHTKKGKTANQTVAFLVMGFFKCVDGFLQAFVQCVKFEVIRPTRRLPG